MPDGRGGSASRTSRRDKRRRRNREREKLIYNLSWILAGLAVGLPMLALILYFLSG